MSLQHWESDDGQKALATMGLSRRVLCGKYENLVFAPETEDHSGRWVWQVVGVDVVDYDESEDAGNATARLRDRAREWLEARRIEIQPVFNFGGPIGWLFKTYGWGRLGEPVATESVTFPDYDSALIAAVNGCEDA